MTDMVLRPRCLRQSGCYVPVIPGLKSGLKGRRKVRQDHKFVLI